MITQEDLQNFFELVIKDDFRGISEQFEENAVFSDPLFPTSPIEGNKSIGKAFAKILALAEVSTFEIKSSCSSNQTAMAEVDTYHRYKGGFEARYMQMFVLELGDSGKIKRANIYNDIRARDLPGILANPFRRYLGRTST